MRLRLLEAKGCQPHGLTPHCICECLVFVLFQRHQTAVLLSDRVSRTPFPQLFSGWTVGASDGMGNAAAVQVLFALFDLVATVKVTPAAAAPLYILGMNTTTVANSTASGATGSDNGNTTAARSGSATHNVAAATAQADRLQASPASTGEMER